MQSFFDHLDSITRLFIAVGVVYNLYQTWKVKRNVTKIEIATNSMKDALVLATAKAATAEGTATGLAEGHAAGLEQGRNEVRK